MTVWPPIAAKMVAVGDDPETYEELAPDELLDGSLVSFRLTAADNASGTITMGSGAAIKVPTRIAGLGGFRFNARLPDGQDVVLWTRVSGEPEAGAPTPLPPWSIHGMGRIVQTLQAHVGEEMCIERYALATFATALQCFSVVSFCDTWHRMLATIGMSVGQQCAHGCCPGMLSKRELRAETAMCWLRGA